MNNIDLSDGTWFLYDGGCPLCHYAAHAARIRKNFGHLYLLDARKANKDHPLLKMIQQHGFDLDEGMVIYSQGTFYHGKRALVFMAHYGENNGLLQRISYFLFSSKKVSALLYPILRWVRNSLLYFRGVTKINNLKNSQYPTFKPVFAQNWEHLQTSLQKHYINRPYSSDRTTINGMMNVDYHWVMNIMRPFYRLIGSIPIERVQNIPVTVHFDSDKDSRFFHFNRIFELPSRPYSFHSRMLQQSNNHVIEIMISLSIVHKIIQL